jgi:hypothetical protein
VANKAQQSLQRDSKNCKSAQFKAFSHRGSKEAIRNGIFQIKVYSGQENQTRGCGFTVHCLQIGKDSSSAYRLF